jgi:hypothetical protein
METNELEIYKDVIPFLITFPKGKLDPDSVRGVHREVCLKKFKKHFGISWKDEYVNKVWYLNFEKNVRYNKLKIIKKK